MKIYKFPRLSKWKMFETKIVERNEAHTFPYSTRFGEW